jgi:hypothetical protein
VVEPVVSLNPYMFQRGISNEAKYSIVVFFKGAAPKRKISV